MTTAVTTRIVELDVHPEGCMCRDCEHAYWAEVEAHEAYIAGIEVA